MMLSIAFATANWTSGMGLDWYCSTECAFLNSPILGPVIVKAVQQGAVELLVGGYNVDYAVYGLLLEQKVGVTPTTIYSGCSAELCSIAQLTIPDDKQSFCSFHW